LYNPYRPTGNDVELTFFGLDSTDINYKILSFQRWVDYFVANTYYRREADTTNADFVMSLDKFKSEAQLYYQDDTSFFFKTYIKFTIAGLDNVQHAAERNRYEKYDFYIKGHPVSYQNDVYMQYMKGFYKNILPRLHEKINRDVYEGVLNASPTLVMRALGYEMTLQNLRVREMVMLNMLTEEFYTGDYPQTNILAILDSVSNMGMFKQHRLIAENLKSRLIELVPGVKAPDFVLIDDGVEAKTLGSYQSKYLYVHVMNPNSDNDIRSLSLLKDLHGKYNDFVNFVTIYRRDDGVALDSNIVAQLDDLPWNVYGLKASNSIWKNYQISTFPHYVLIDLHGFIVASPALSPTPNGQYETIDKTFYLIQQAIKRNGQ
jgi:hypothetical protein